jgi:catecholate siderophore receptor
MKALVWLALVPLTVVAQEEIQQQSGEQRIEVIDVIGTANETVMPHEQPVSGIFGLSDAVHDITRGVTVIDESLMQETAIDDLHDIARFAPSAYAPSGFGTPSLPSIRGQLGELFQAGMRRQAGNNGLGVPLSLNGVERIVVARGAPPIMLGTTQRVGGFVDLQPKQAHTDEATTKLIGRIGEWQQHRLQVDQNWVIAPNQQALRVSAEYVDEGSFYDYSGLRSDSVVVAYRYQPNAQTDWAVSLEYYDAQWTDNAGINRPTQALIDDNLYITGIGVQPNNSEVPGAFAVISPTGQVRIPRSQVLTDPLDTNTATTWLLHSTYSRQLNNDVTLVNRTYYQHLNRDGINQNSFVEIIDGAETFENRLELHWQQGTTLGANVRINDVLGYSQFTTEADLPIDLTAGLEARRIPLTEAQQARLVELQPGLFVSPGAQYDRDGDGVGDFNLSDTTNSNSTQFGVFAQQEFVFTDTWSSRLGARADFYDVSARDPIAPAGVTPAADTHHDWLFAWHADTRVALTPNMNVYATAYWSDSTSNSMAGGHVLNAAGEIDSQNFATENTLYEVGMKYQPEGERWYADAAVFEQTRSLRNRDGSNSGILTRGVEAQWNYRHEAGYWMTLAATYIDARFDNSAAFQDSRQVADAFDNSRPDIIEGTGVGAPNFAAFAPSNQRVQGIPPVQLSAAWGWSFTSQWQLGGDISYTKSYPLDYLQTVMIRDQHLVNMNLSWQVTPAFNARLEVLNLTDQDNWSPVFEGGYFGSTLAFPVEPRHARIRLEFSF